MTDDQGASEPSARLRELGDYLIELAESADATLYSLPALPFLHRHRTSNVDDLPRLVQLARWEYEHRERRKRYFRPDLLGEPAWDMLLDLFLARADGLRLSVSSVCIGSRVPLTTALRWLAILEGEGLTCRKQDEADKRRSWIELTPTGAQAMIEWLGDKDRQISGRLVPEVSR